MVDAVACMATEFLCRKERFAFRSVVWCLQAVDYAFERCGSAAGGNMFRVKQTLCRVLLLRPGVRGCVGLGIL